MTASNNPFANRIAAAAKEGYVDYAGFRRSNAPVRPFGIEFRTEAGPAMITDKQRSLIESLLTERDLTAEQRPKYRARLAALAADHREVAELTREKASALITHLFGLPQVTTTADCPAIPAGHYALEQDGVTSFFRVDRPEEGQWAGKTFVALQHGDEYTTMGRRSGETILMMILDQGVLECSARYGRAIGRCGVCHRTLTNEDSREAGIGPVCRGKLGV